MINGFNGVQHVLFYANNVLNSNFLDIFLFARKQSFDTSESVKGVLHGILQRRFILRYGGPMSNVHH